MSTPVAVRIDDGSTVLVGEGAEDVAEVIRLNHGLVALVYLRGEAS